MSDLKSFFETPQKTRLTIICLAVAAVTFIAVLVYAVLSLQHGADVPPAQSEAVSDTPARSEAPVETEAPTQELVGIVPSLTIDEARELALADAGVAEGEAEVSREALTQDNGLWVYEFRFRTQEAQYEYKLNANTGELRSKVKEPFVYPSPEVSAPLDSAPPAQSARPASSAPPAGSVPPAADMGVEQAKAAALADAGVSAAQAAFTKAEPDYEDGKLVYDIEFFTSTHEYEYEIDAATGAVRSRSAEAFQTAAPSAAPGGSYIGMDRAKSIALEHAGLTSAQVSFTHTRMDRDHGTMVYEIEFRQGRVEYEYEIDAATGRVLDYERDAD